MNAWLCERCKSASTAGTVSDTPSGWETRSMPVRGTKGARSSRPVVLCDSCDDDLYHWICADAAELRQALAIAERVLTCEADQADGFYGGDLLRWMLDGGA